VTGNSFRDGYVHVCAERCATCIFEPGNRMHLNRGRVRDMVDECKRIEGVIPCHKTLDGDQAICCGFYELYGSQIMPLRLATVMERIRRT
jgi:hypothetical protein